MKTYEGINDWQPGGRVLVDGEPLNPCMAVHPEIAPDGLFGWAGKGSGVQRLALAILADALDHETARECYLPFTQGILAHLPRESNWKLTEAEVREAVEKIRGGGWSMPWS